MTIDLFTGESCVEVKKIVWKLIKSFETRARSIFPLPRSSAPYGVPVSILSPARPPRLAHPPHLEIREVERRGKQTRSSKAQKQFDFFIKANMNLTKSASLCSSSQCLRTRVIRKVIADVLRIAAGGAVPTETTGVTDTAAATTDTAAATAASDSVYKSNYNKRNSSSSK